MSDTIERDPSAGERGDASGGDGGMDELLADPHCRYLLSYLNERGDAVAVSEAARHVVAGITDDEPDDVSGDVQRRVQTWFHHGLLPTLDERGVVAFDPESNTVELRDEDAV